MEMVTMRWFEDATGKGWLEGHGWCIEWNAGRRAIPGSSAELGPKTKYLGTFDIPKAEIEGCELGLNNRERQVYMRLREEGKTVLRAGWPDLLVIDGDETYAVEVKSPVDKPSARQVEMHEALAKAGLRVEVETVR